MRLRRLSDVHATGRWRCPNIHSQDAFWTLAALLDSDKYLKNFFDPKLTGVIEMASIFDHLLHKRFRKLAAHIVRHWLPAKPVDAPPPHPRSPKLVCASRLCWLHTRTPRAPTRGCTQRHGS